MDAVDHILAELQLRASVFLHEEFCGSWAVDTSGTQKGTFHLIARGTCWLHAGGEAMPVALRAGDLVVFPHDATHTLSDGPSPPDPSVPINRPCEAPVGAPTTALICGYFDFAERRWNPLLDALPPMVVVRSDEIAQTAAMEGLIRLLIHEGESHQPGAATVVNKLADVLFVQMLRCYLRSQPASGGFIAALTDKYIGPALTRMHSQPQHDWQLARLAEQSGLSRSAFAQRFRQLVGQPPLQYLGRWRMQQAFKELRDTDKSIARIAEQSGYASQAAFSKAFKKIMGMAPGAARKGL